jgi:hypothetical protein
MINLKKDEEKVPALLFLLDNLLLVQQMQYKHSKFQQSRRRSNHRPFYKRDRDRF